MNNKQVWFVTGASKGLGLELVKKLLQEGHRVAASSRNAGILAEAAGVSSETFLPLAVDLRDDNSVAEALKTTVNTFGSLDVVVNNAGYGIGGTVEELSNKEISESFDINVYATIRVIKYALPYMRERRKGHIINISSIAGFAATTGWAIYGAAKSAVMGLSEVLAQDLKSLGINVTVVAPGAFRTQFLSEGSLVLSATKIEDYQEVRQSHERYLKMNGQQAGDPAKAAEVFIRLAEMSNPPVRLFLGSDAVGRASAKIDNIKAGLEEYKDLSASTDFSEG